MSVVSLSAIAMAIGCAVMAGVYATFSGFVMKALASLEGSEGVHAMQSINEVTHLQRLHVLEQGHPWRGG